MATDLYQLDRIRNLLSTKPVQWEEKKNALPAEAKTVRFS